VGLSLASSCAGYVPNQLPFHGRRQPNYSLKGLSSSFLGFGVWNKLNRKKTIAEIIKIASTRIQVDLVE